MKKVLLVAALSLSCFAGAVLSAIPKAPKERLVKAIDLQPFFHTAHPWQVKIYQPVGENAEFGNRPVRVCFVKQGAKPYTDCTALFGGVPQSDGRVLPLQTLDRADMEMLPSLDGGPGRPSLVVRATFAGGGAGELKGLYVWTDISSAHQGLFAQTFQSVISQAGDQRFLKKGPLAGAFVAIDQVHEGNEANMESPVRYQMSIYEPAPLGYVKVLSMLSEHRYPSNHTRDGLTDAIATLTPAMSRALKAVYPDGVAVLQR